MLSHYISDYKGCSRQTLNSDAYCSVHGFFSLALAIGHFAGAVSAKHGVAALILAASVRRWPGADD